jgi:hypothetical protein
MNGRDEQGDANRFLLGLAVGSIIGAGLVMSLTSRAAGEFRARAVDSGRALGNAVAGRVRGARLRVAETVGGIARKGQDLRNEALDTAVRAAQGVEAGARGVQHFAIDAKTKVG